MPVLHLLTILLFIFLLATVPYLFLLAAAVAALAGSQMVHERDKSPHRGDHPLL